MELELEQVILHKELYFDPTKYSKHAAKLIKVGSYLMLIGLWMNSFLVDIYLICHTEKFLFI